MEIRVLFELLLFDKYTQFIYKKLICFKFGSGYRSFGYFCQLEIDDDYLTFTSLDELFNFESYTNKHDYIKSLDEMSKYARHQLITNFDFQKYEHLL